MERENIIGILSNMKSLHAMLPVSEQAAVNEYLNDCQQGAISVGNYLEKTAEIENEDNSSIMLSVVHDLEEYCEQIYNVAQSEQVSINTVAGINAVIDHISEKINKIKIRYNVVFLPYKAEMWDSLESIYLAAASDPECDAKVVPIPYFEKDVSAGKWVACYDGDRFPKNIPVTSYTEYDIEREEPDIAYIHNPYDDGNFVTTVHEKYYSRNLKKYVGRLVYVPYYVTSGPISADHKITAVTENMDYAVLQSEYMKEMCRDMDWYDKVLPLGSPKLDRVIEKCKEGVHVPDEWKKVIGGRRTLMLNTSLNDLLCWGESELEKLSCFFRLMKDNRDICIIWRPHPLYESAIRSMKPELFERFQQIKNYYINEKIGVLDMTPDVSDTVAIADGYIGAASTSVINLFGIAGKPAFLFNDLINERFLEYSKRVIPFSGLAERDGRIYAAGYLHNLIYEFVLPEDADSEIYNKDVVQVRLNPVGRFPDRQNFASLYGIPCSDGNKLYMPPVFAENASVFEIDKSSVYSVGLGEKTPDTVYSFTACVGDSVFFLPDNKLSMPEYVEGKGELIYHRHFLGELYKNVERRSVIPLVNGYAVYKRYLYISTGQSNRIAKIEAGTDKSEMLYLAKPELDKRIKPVLKGADEGGLWLELVSQDCDLEEKKGKVLYFAPWEKLSDYDSWKCYDMPENFEYNVSKFAGNIAGIFLKTLEFGRYVLAIPALAQGLIRIDTESGQVVSLADEFFKDCGKPCNGYAPEYIPCIIAHKLLKNGRLIIQRSCDRHLAYIDIETGAYREFVPALTENDYNNTFGGLSGFEKQFDTDYFAMRESQFNTLQDFLAGFARDGWADIKKRQLSELSTMAANLDGTCGRKVHEYMMRVIKAK